MDNPKKKYYLTTPIYYANSRPHVGSAYTTIVCDVIARYKRMCGYEVAYLTGTDEHGVNIERAAERLGISPADLVDRNQQIFRDLWKLLGISYTDFVRTTEPRHAVAVQNLSPPHPARIARCDLQTQIRRPLLHLRQSLRQRHARPRRLPNLRPPRRADLRRKLFLPPVRISGKTSAALQRPAGFRPTGFSPERSEEFRRKRPERSFHQPQDHQVGHSLARRSRTRLLRLVRRSNQLHERHRLRRWRAQ